MVQYIISTKFTPQCIQLIQRFSMGLNLYILHYIGYNSLTENNYLLTGISQTFYISASLKITVIFRHAMF